MAVSQRRSTQGTTPVSPRSSGTRVRPSKQAVELNTAILDSTEIDQTRQELFNRINMRGWQHLRTHIPTGLISSLSSYTIPLATEATKYLNEKLEFFCRLPASQKSEIQYIVQKAISQFIDWAEQGSHDQSLVFPFTEPNRTLARLLSMQQTVDITRSTLEFFEEGITFLADSTDQAQILRELVLRYGWEVGFATATAYATVAESRGSLDSRLEASLVDGIIRNEDANILLSQANALNINTQEPLTFVALTHDHNTVSSTENRTDFSEQLIIIQRLAQKNSLHMLGGLHGDRIILLLFGQWEQTRFLHDLLSLYPHINIVIGEQVPSLTHARQSAQATLSAINALPAWSDAPSAVYSTDLLPERAMLGEAQAREEMITRFIAPIRDAGTVYIETVEKFLSNTSVELTAADLFVHQNTVRYRLKKITELNGLDVFNTRDEFTLRLAFMLARLAGLTKSTHL